MTAKLVDALAATVAFPGILILPSEDAIRRLRSVLGQEARFERPGNDGAERHLILDRERITITQHDGGSSVMRDYPQPDDLAMLDDLAARCIETLAPEVNTDQNLAYTVRLVFEQDIHEHAGAYIAEKLLGPHVRSEGREFLDCSCTINFRDDEGIWAYHIEPRFRESGTTRVFVAAQLVVANTSLPLRGEMERRLSLVWNAGARIMGATI